MLLSQFDIDDSDNSDFIIQHSYIIMLKIYMFQNIHRNRGVPFYTFK